MNGYLQDDNGDNSAGRLIAVVAVIVFGGALIGFGILLSFLELNSPKGGNAGPTLAGLGVTCVITGAGLKGWQKRSEAQMSVQQQGQPSVSDGK